MRGLKLYRDRVDELPPLNESNLSDTNTNILNVLESYGLLKTREVTPIRILTAEYKEYIKRNRSVKYLQSVCGSMKLLENYFGAHYAINNITVRSAEKFVYKLMDEIPKGYRVYFRNLKAMFNCAMRWGYISENPFSKIKLPRIQKLKPHFITEEQLERVCASLDNKVLKDAIRFSFYTGLRLSEMVNLKWANVDLEKIEMTIGDSEFTTKSRKSRTVPINKKAGDILVGRIEYKSISRFIFGNEKGFRYTGDWYSRNFKRAVRKSGLGDEIHWHSLRHSFASNLVQKGASIYAVKELMCHSSISVTEIYLNSNMTMLREAIGCLE